MPDWSVMHTLMLTLSIVKLGSEILDDPNSFETALFAFSKIDDPKILVHSGGSIGSQLAEKLGITPEKLTEQHPSGNRTTDILINLYAGILNKKVVDRLQSLGCDAVGLIESEAGSTLTKTKKLGPITISKKGDIKKIYTPVVGNLLKDGLTPVFCAITQNGEGQVFKTNANAMATALALELIKDFQIVLKYCDKRDGLLADPNNGASILKSLSNKEYKNIKKTGNLNDDAITLIDYAFEAKKAKVKNVFICGLAGIQQNSVFQGTEII